MNKDDDDTPHTSFGLDDDEENVLQDDMEQRIVEGNDRFGYGGNPRLEVLSVEQMLRKDSGYYGVKGMIVGVSSVEHVVVSTEFGCSACDNLFTMEHNPPLFSLPSHLNLNKTRKCECNSLSFGPKKHKEKAIVRILLQDEKMSETSSP
jgi:hypothetical protein